MVNFLKSRKLENRICYRARKVPAISQVMNFNVFSVSFVTILLLGTLALHELGHVFMAKAYACNYSAVLYKSETISTTQVVCEKKPNEAAILLGGVILTTLLAFMLFVSGIGVINLGSHLIFAFGLIIASRDFIDLGIPEIPVYILDIFAVALIMYSVVKIIILYAEECRKIRILKK